MGQRSSRPTGFGGYYGSKEPMMTRATLFYTENMLLQSHGGLGAGPLPGPLPQDTRTVTDRTQKPAG